MWATLTAFQFLNEHELALAWRLLQRIEREGQLSVHAVPVEIPTARLREKIVLALQLAGLLVERTRAMRSLIRRRTFLSRIYAYAFTLLPAPLLFPSPFIHNVILPFLKSIGGLS